MCIFTLHFLFSPPFLVFVELFEFERDHRRDHSLSLPCRHIFVISLEVESAFKFLWGWFDLREATGEIIPEFYIRGFYSFFIVCM